jgi:hypothetical protein
MRPVRRAAYGFGRWNRRRKARFALAVIERLGVESVLLVGVTGWPSPVMNRVESTIMRRVPSAVACGIDEEASGWPRFVLADGRRLPFRADAFDLVYANAVIEHVGGRDDQRRFMGEVARVGRSWIVTTPNRWFPIEAHYHTFFSHWLSGWCPRGVVTRLLGIRDLRELAPEATIRGVPLLSPTLTAFGSSHASPVRKAVGARYRGATRSVGQ